MVALSNAEVMRSIVGICAIWAAAPLYGQSLLQPLDYGANNYVVTMLPDPVNDVLYIGGGFIWVNDSVLSPGVAKWTGEQFEPVGCGVGLAWCDASIPHDQPLGNPVKTLAIWNGDLYAGGWFNYTANGEDFNFMARWDGTEWHPVGAGMDGPVQDLKSTPDALYAAGWFNTADGDSCRGLAKWNGFVWSAVAPVPLIDNGAGSPALNALEVIGDSVYLGGNFFGPGNMQSFIWYDGSQWFGVQNGLTGGIADVDCIELIDGEIIVGGSFAPPPYGAATNPGSGILKTDGVSWTTVGEGTLGAYNPQVSDVVQWTDGIIAVGKFDRMGGVPTDCLSSWDGARWCSLLPENYLDNVLNCAAVFHDTLYIGGGFHTAGGDTIRFVAKYIGTAPDTCGFAVGVLEQLPTTNQLLLWPNPAQDQLHLANTTEAYATITDAMGRQVMIARIAPHGTLWVGALAGGCYVLHLHQKDGSQRFIGRFIKQ